MRFFDQAAVFTEACLEYGVLPRNKETCIPPPPSSLPFSITTFFTCQGLCFCGNKFILKHDILFDVAVFALCLHTFGLKSVCVCVLICFSIYNMYCALRQVSMLKCRYNRLKCRHNLCVERMMDNFSSVFQNSIHGAVNGVDIASAVLVAPHLHVTHDLFPVV